MHVSKKLFVNSFALLAALSAAGCQLSIFGGPGGSVHQNTAGGPACDPDCSLDTTVASGEVYVAVADTGYEFSSWENGATFCTETSGPVCTVEQYESGIPQFENLAAELVARFVPVVDTAGASNLTGLWLQYADNAYTGVSSEESFDENFKEYTVFRIVDNGNGTLGYQDCAGPANEIQYASLPVTAGKFTIPANARSMDEWLPSPQTVTIIDNVTMTFSNFSVSEDEGDGQESAKFTNIRAIKVRDDYSSPIGTTTIGSTTEDTYCFKASTTKGTGVFFGQGGDPDVDISFTGAEIRADWSAGHELEIGSYDAIIGGIQSDEGYAEHFNWQTDTLIEEASDGAIFNVSFSADHLIYTGSSTIGASNTPASIAIDLN